MIISRYHLPVRGTPEVVQIKAADLHVLLLEPLAALKRCLSQIRGALPIQDAEEAIRVLENALAELNGTAHSVDDDSTERIAWMTVVKLGKQLKDAESCSRDIVERIIEHFADDDIVNMNGHEIAAEIRIEFGVDEVKNP